MKINNIENVEKLFRDRVKLMKKLERLQIIDYMVTVSSRPFGSDDNYDAVSYCDRDFTVKVNLMMRKEIQTSLDKVNSEIESL